MVPMTWSGRSCFTASLKRAPALIRGQQQNQGQPPFWWAARRAAKKRGLSLNSSGPSLAEEVLDPIALFVQLLERGVHALFAEFAHLEALDDLVAAVAAGDRVAVDDALGNAIAAVRRDAHRHPVAVARPMEPVAHMVDGGVG